MKVPTAIDVMLDHADLLERVIAGLEARGYKVLTVEKLAELERAIKEAKAAYRQAPLTLAEEWMMLNRRTGGTYDSEPIAAGPAPRVKVIDVSEHGKPLRLARPAAVPEPGDAPFPDPPPQSNEGDDG